MRRPLLWIVGVWILGELAAVWLGWKIVPATSLDIAMEGMDSAMVEATGRVVQFRHTSSGFSYLLDEAGVILQGNSGSDSRSDGDGSSDSGSPGNDSGIPGNDSGIPGNDSGDSLQTHRLLVYTTDLGDLQIGDYVGIEGELSPFDAAANEGQFDRNRWYRSQNIDYSLTESAREIRDSGSHSAADDMKGQLWKLKELLRESLCAAAPESDSGVLISVFLGDKTLLDPEIRDLYRDGGISHILAISGLHISLFGMALYQWLRKVGMHPVPAGILCGNGAAAYVWMTGNASSAKRAFLMFCCFLLAKAVGRTYDLISALSLAALLLLKQYPLLLFQGSFQLSFLAMAGIGVIWTIWEKWSAGEDSEDGSGG